MTRVATRLKCTAFSIPLDPQSDHQIQCGIRTNDSNNHFHKVVVYTDCCHVTKWFVACYVYCASIFPTPTADASIASLHRRRVVIERRIVRERDRERN